MTQLAAMLMQIAAKSAGADHASNDKQSPEAMVNAAHGKAGPTAPPPKKKK